MDTDTNFMDKTLSFFDEVFDAVRDESGAWQEHGDFQDDFTDKVHGREGSDDFRRPKNPIVVLFNFSRKVVGKVAARRPKNPIVVLFNFSRKLAEKVGGVFSSTMRGPPSQDEREPLRENDVK